MPQLGRCSTRHGKNIGDYLKGKKHLFVLPDRAVASSDILSNLQPIVHRSLMMVGTLR